MKYINRMKALLEKGDKMPGQEESIVPLRGYVKQDGVGWSAICIDLNIVAQGNTPEEAVKACFDLILEYLTYVFEEYPGEIDKYLRRPAPQEFIDEFYSSVRLAIRPSATRRSINPHGFNVTSRDLGLCSA